MKSPITLRLHQAIVLLLALLVFVTAEAAVAKEPEYEWTGVERIVAIGDIHGAFDNFVAVLKNAKLVDHKLRWTGGKTHLVQNGDILDRGPHSRKTMNLLMKLQDKAEDDGGRVHVLIGNHEAMNVVGLTDLVSAREFESYIDHDSAARRASAFERYYEALRREARAKDERLPRKSLAERDFKKKYPLGWLEHRSAFGKNGEYGSWIRRLNAAIKINGVVFSHGDFSEKFSEIGIEALNQRVRQELSGEIPIENGYTFDTEAPLQYRGLAQVNLNRVAQEAELARVDRILANLGATRMVVGHTSTPGVIVSRFGGKHISIDTGMLELYRGGHRAALLIEGEGLEAIHDGGAVEIPGWMDDSNFASYVKTVSAVDPDNVDAQLILVDSLRTDGSTAEAVTILESLFERPNLVPFRYHKFLGAQYEARSELERARSMYLTYIDGLNELVNANPDNLNLANLLARFCIEKTLKLDLAAELVGRVIAGAPNNDRFQLIQATLHMARSDYQEAIFVLERISKGVGLDYDIYVMTGRAYAGRNETARAREAFESALQIEPERDEAKKELEKLGGLP
jgi:tetratricopeptide (TPR) repeat protein